MEMLSCLADPLFEIRECRIICTTDQLDGQIAISGSTLPGKCIHCSVTDKKICPTNFITVSGLALLWSR